MPAEPLGILLISGTHERAHYAFVLAAAAAAIGRKVTVFATNEGCRALLDDWSGLADPERDVAVRLRGVAGIGELRESSRELGVRMIACEAGMRVVALDAAALTQGAEVGGVVSFLEATQGGTVISL